MAFCQWLYNYLPSISQSIATCTSLQKCIYSTLSLAYYSAYLTRISFARLVIVFWRLPRNFDLEIAYNISNLMTKIGNFRASSTTMAGCNCDYGKRSTTTRCPCSRNEETSPCPAYAAARPLLVRMACYRPR